MANIYKGTLGLVGNTPLALLPDSGDRYYSTALFTEQ